MTETTTAQGTVVEIDNDGDPLGLVIDQHTLVTMIQVWGRPYIPTVLRPHGSQTPNTLPLSTLAQQMSRFGLGVDIDVINHGQRTASDTYADLYATMLADRPAAGQRTTTLVVRLDTRATDTAAGLTWRTDSGAAAAAVTRRIVRALRHNDCRAQAMTANEIRQAVADMHDCTTNDIAAAYREGWRELSHRGTYISSYYLSAEDLTTTHLGDMWAVNADHTVVALHLRRDKTSAEVAVSATVRFTTAQPQQSAPAVILNRYTGRQWWALSGLLPGAHRVSGIPSRTLTPDLDDAVPIGPSGILIGKTGDGLLMMPLRDPAGHTCIVIDTDNDYAVRQLIRRAAASGEIVAVYDPQRRWAMAASSSRIWNTPTLAAQPPRKPTVVVHNGTPGNYPDAPTTICAGPSRRSAAPPDIHLTHRRHRIVVATERFTADLDAVSFRNEQNFLN